MSADQHPLLAAQDALIAIDHADHMFAYLWQITHALRDQPPATVFVLAEPPENFNALCEEMQRPKLVLTTVSFTREPINTN
jgi:hypothetical protein